MMKDDRLISVKKIMVHHKLDKTFIEDLEAYQLVEFVVKDTERYLYARQLPLLEQIIRLHYSLEINMEGIDVIRHMIDRMEHMHQTIQQLKNRLNLYE